MRQTWKKRLLALVLTVCTILGMGIPAQAASIADGSKTCTVALAPIHSYLQTTAGTWLRAGGYNYTTNDNITGPAYCIDHGLAFTDKVLPITGKYEANPATAGAFANGYPQHSVETFLDLYLEQNSVLEGLTEDEFRYATQLAVWATLGQLGVDGTPFTSGREYIMPQTGDLQQQRVFRTVQLLCGVASTWDRVYRTGMYIRLDENELGGNEMMPASMTLEAIADQNLYGVKLEVINGKSYYTKEYIFASATSTYYNDYTLELWATNCPAGTIFTDLNNVELPRSNWRETPTWRCPTETHATNLNYNGYELWCKAKLCIPADTAPPSGEITLHCAAAIMQYEIFLANNESNAEQSYIIADPSKGTLEADAVLSWGGPLTEVGYLLLTKVDGGGLPLAGAKFTLSGTDGKEYTGTTDENGEIFWQDLNPNALYTLVETEAPAGYGLVEPRTVKATAAKIEYITVQDPALNTLTVHKIDRQNGCSLRGAVYCFEQIDGTFKTTAVTDHAGNIQFNADRLPIGSYKVYEVQAPDGYELDSTAQTVNWDGLRDVTLTFKDTRKPTLIIAKQDSRTKYSLPGASFAVYKDGSLVTTVTTNDNGLAYVSGLTSGYYEVKEVTAPQGYTLNEKVYGVNIDQYDPSTENDPRLVVENDPLPSLRILKYDRETGKPLADTTFKVYRDASLFGTYTTDKHGEILLTGLEPGTYAVEEINATTHVADAPPQQIELQAGRADIATLVFFNSIKPGIRITKIDADTLQPLAGAAFQITQIGGTYSKELQTDKNGEIDLSALAEGSYTIQETVAPAGYLLDSTLRTVQLKAGQDAEFVFTNTKLPSLKLTKQSSDGKPLEGVTFRIAYVEDGTHYMDRTTDSNGEIVIEGLEPGVLSIVETATAADHILDPTEHHVELIAGQTATISLKNDKRPNLTIHKADADTDEPVAGTVFLLKGADGHSVAEVTTGKDGSATIPNLIPGVYEVVEKSVPAPYLLDAESQTITLYPNTDRDVYFRNHKKPTLTVNKVDSVTGDPIQGAKFSVTYASNNTSTGEINDLGTFYSNANGQFFIDSLQDGWYKVTEVEPAKGYSIQAPATQEVYIKGGESKVLTFKNVPLSALVVWKYDSLTGSAVEGAVFQVRYLGGTSGSGGTVIGTYMTSVNGSFTVTGLAAGTYVVEELASDEDHVIDTAPQTAYLSGKEQDVVQLSFGNSPKGSLTVKKVDSVTHEPLSDTEFLVTTADGSYVGSANGKYTTDSSGSFTINGIDPGTALVIKETRAKSGYLLDDTAQTITIAKGQAAVLEFRNQPLGALVVTKYDSVTNKPLSGATFQITTSSGEFVAAQGGAVSSNGIYTTDKNGQIVLTGLQPDTYVVTETKAPSGYELDSKPQTVRVNTNDTQTLYFYNTPSPVGSLRITKLDEETRQPISGVTFEVRHMDGSFLGTYRTNSKGVILLEDLEPDWYTVTETRAADGYALDAQPRDVQVKNGQTATLEVTNRLTGSALIHKVDAITGKGIYGVVFLVSDAKGYPVGQYTTDQDGYIYIQGELADGRYTIREIQQADGYLPDTTVKTFWVEYGCCSTITWKNTPVQGQIQITKTSADYNSTNGWPAGTPIPGTEFEVYNRAGVLVDTIRTDKNGVAATKALPLGRYTLVESKAADYYQLDKTPIEVEIEFAGQIVRTAMTNKSIRTGVSISKTGYAEVMPGQTIRYTFSGIGNDSTVALTSFYWRDILPTNAVRLSSITTGTWNAQGTYKVVYRTNLSGEVYRTLADNLSTQKNYTINASPVALGLASNEYVTEVMFTFGVVPAGFRQVEAPKMDCTVLTGLQNGFQFANAADVGGVYNGAWVQASSRWVTTVYAPTKPLPRTGY